MEFDVDWAGIACSLVGSLVGCYFCRKSEELLQHYKSAETFDPSECQHGSSRLVFVDLGTVKDSEGYMEVVNHHGAKIKVVAKVQTVKENRIVFNPAVRLWLSSPSVLSRIHSSIPFSLETTSDKNNSSQVIISSPDVAHMDHVMTPISTVIQPVLDSSFFSNALDFISGEKTRSYETTVKGLSVGTRISAIGWISSQQSRNMKALGLRTKTKWFIGDDPSGKGFSLILSTKPMNDLIAQEKTRGFYLKLILCGFLVASTIFVARKSWKSVQEFIRRRQFAHSLQSFVNQRRNNNRNADLSADADAAELERTRTCIICLENRRETVFVPCAHVCACMECANQMRTLPDVNRCPVCRNVVTSVSIIRFP